MFEQKENAISKLLKLGQISSERETCSLEDFKKIYECSLGFNLSERETVG